MRLLIATDAFPPKCGGSGWSTFYLARALQARGHAVEVIQPKQGAPGIVSRVYEDIAVIEFGFSALNLPGWRVWRRSLILDNQFASFLAKRAREADVIHAQHLLTIPPAVKAGRIARVPVVSTVRDYWPICLYGTLWRNNSTCSGCRGMGRIDCLQARYGPFARWAYPALPFMAAEITRWQRALQSSSAVIAVSHFVADRLAGIVDPARLHIIPNLVDPAELEQLAASAATPNREPYLIYIGKLNSAKGADCLPELMARSGTAMKLLVVGDGELTGFLTGIPNVELCGWLSNRDALGLLAGSRALVLPSRWPEPLSRVLLEAQALGVPTVALDTGGTRDIIQHEVNGLLATDLAEMAASITRVVDDDELCARLSLGARQVARNRFSESVVAAQFAAVYQHVQPIP